MVNTCIKHPRSLKTFFLTEMWERYGFYVVQTLLALYLATHLGWKDKKVYELVGSLTALTYISPVIGGWIADHLIGQRAAIISGGIILFLSYITLGLISSDSKLCLTLAGVAVGSGLLKPNISSLLGNEYPDNSPIRENGFTIFYMGITVGIILGTTLPSYFSEHFGWSTAFISASVGMILALFSFVHGVYFYKITDYTDHGFDFKKIALALVLAGFIWVSNYYILTFPSLAQGVFIAVVLACVFYFYLCIKNESKKQSKLTIIIGLLCLISIMFWAFYFQMFLSLTLFISRAVEPTILGLQFPPPYYVGIQSIGMIIFGIFLCKNKKKLDISEQTKRTGNKFFLSMCCMLISYLLITLICHIDYAKGLIPVLMLIPTYLIISLAELLISPVGLAAVTLLSNRKKVSTMIGIFFVSLGIGGFLSGKLANITSIPDANLSFSELKIHYTNSFTNLLLILACATLLSLVINLIIKRLMSDK